MTDEFDMFDCLDSTSDKIREYDVVRAPLAWPGGKTRIADKIAKILPITDAYVEPFGGSAAVMLARPPVRMEVYNDRFGGIVAFYRCLKSPTKYKKMVDWLDATMHSREEFRWCKENWENAKHFDDVERACMWYYMMSYSFSGLGRHWGRATGPVGRLAGKVREKIKEFPAIHKRLSRVQLENQDWRKIFQDYDSYDTVFYCDPPYLEVNSHIYDAGELSLNDHAELLDTIKNCKGYVAISSYQNNLYESHGWDDRHVFEKNVTMQAMAHAKGSKREKLKGVEERGTMTEILYVKEAGDA